MKVIWDPAAKQAKQQIAEYIRKQFGIGRVKKFRQEVDQAARLLMRHPNLGSIDPLYADRAVAYRSIIINNLSKLVYRIEEDIIYIAAFWDCRREPTNQAAKTDTTQYKQ